MQLIDTHSHLYSSKFQPDLDEVISRAQDVLSHVFLPNVDLASIGPMKALAERAPGFFMPMMGLHPCHVEEGYPLVLEAMEEQFDGYRFYGVGETGLDLYWDKTTLARQVDSLRVHCRWARERGLPIILHARDAIDELIGVIAEEQDGRLSGIFHCFTGDLVQARRIMDLGFYMGLGGVLTYKKSGLDAVVKDIPMESLVLETDAPYLPPTPHRGKRNESSYTAIVARKLAEVKDLPLAEVARITTENALAVFQMDPAAAKSS